MISKSTVCVILCGFSVLGCKGDREGKDGFGGKQPMTDGHGGWEKGASEDYNSVIFRYEAFVVSVWNAAKESIRMKKKSFLVSVEGKNVQFELSESRGPAEYLVGGGVKGIISISYDSLGEVSSAIFQPWDPSIRDIRTRVILESPESPESEELRKIFNDEN
ncbi:MAG: hypothetical protein EOP84_02080 [Verrucomicrobiaceae bacterium]|nr:MAG: hypothetical protein EOP84_02080 [Verrucomicrobiaceae bacterium]